jgi:two-component system, chemotaxis family, chemotaxis protein CheY
VAQFSSMHVVVVDDFGTMRKIVSNCLRGVGIRKIKEYENGKVALEYLTRSTEVGLIVCDWNMPEMTGLELLKALRGMDQYKRIPFLMVTAEGKPENVLEAAKAGATGFIIKPFAPDVLQRKIRELFR